MKQLRLLILSLFVTQVAVGQDIHFSQFWNSPTLMNPAATGDFNTAHRFFVQYRDQWRSVSNPYQTFAGGYDTRLFVKQGKKDHWGLGFSVFKDVAGDSRMGTLLANMNTAYHTELTPNNHFSFGFQAGIRQHSISTDGARWGNQYDGVAYDPTIASDENFMSENFMVGDISAGTQYAFIPHNMFELKAGVALQHINTPRISYDALFKDESYRKIVGHLSADIGIDNTNTAIMPLAFFYRQGPSTELTVGSLVRYQLTEASKYTFWKRESAIYFGGLYRLQDAIIATTQLEIESFFLALSYDINISGLSAVTYGRGGFEITLKYVAPFVSRHYGKRPRMR